MSHNGPEAGVSPKVEEETIAVRSQQIAQNPSFVLQEPGKVSYEDRPVPELKNPDDVIVEVKYTGICGSDVHYWTSGRIGSFIMKAPMVLGHESAGVVHAVGDAVRGLRPGAAVALEPGAPCRRCPRCREGRYNLCVAMVFAATPPYDGTLARYYVLPADFCHALPAGAPLAHGALMEPAAVAVHVCRQVGVRAGTASVVVFGAGPIGLLCCAVARAFGAADVVCVDINEERVKFAEKYAGARAFRSDRNKSPEENGAALVEECGLGLGADAVIDATGAAVCVQTGIWALRTGGTYCQAGMGAPDISFPIMAFCNKEITMKGSFRYGPGDYETAIQLLASGALKADELITRTVPFDQAEVAFQDVRDGKGIKTIIEGPQ